MDSTSTERTERQREQSRLWAKMNPEKVKVAMKRRYARDPQANAARKKAERKAREAGKLCTWCTWPARPGRKLCEYHKEMNRIKGAIAYYRRRGRPVPQRLIDAREALKRTRP